MMHATAYSFVALPAEPPSPAPERFQLFHNGNAVLDGVRDTREDAWELAFEMSASLGTSLRCFKVRKVQP